MSDDKDDAPRSDNPTPRASAMADVLEAARKVRASLTPDMPETERAAAWNVLDEALLEFDRLERRAPGEPDMRSPTYKKLTEMHGLLVADVRGMRNVLGALDGEGNLACAVRAMTRLSGERELPPAAGSRPDSATSKPRKARINEPCKQCPDCECYCDCLRPGAATGENK